MFRMPNLDTLPVIKTELGIKKKEMLDTMPIVQHPKRYQIILCPHNHIIQIGTTQPKEAVIPTGIFISVNKF